MNIQKGKFYKTRDGRKVEVYATNKGNHQPIHAAITSGGDFWTAVTYDAEGRYNIDKSEHDFDIIEEWVSEGWIVLFDGGCGPEAWGTIFDTYEEAEEFAIEELEWDLHSIVKITY
jgi:hypothetical protein